MTYVYPARDFAADNHLLKLQRLQNKVLCAIGTFSKAHTGSRFSHGFQTSVYIYNKIIQATSRSRTKS
jgi:hypothetical protein